MVRPVKNQIKQGRPVISLEEEVFVNFARTMDALLRGVEQTLKPAGLSPTQYNVLRILRGAELGGLPCRAVAERLVTRDPDMTRLLDRLEARGLVTRTRELGDRRVITTRITPAGLRLLSELDEPIAALHRGQLGPLGARRLKLLNELLNRTREAVR